MKKTALMFVTVILSSCNNQENKTTETSAKTETNLQLIGKKATATFQDMKVQVTYLTDSTLHWKTTDAKGVVTEGDEKTKYKMLTDNLHFINWIEKDGFTISQVIDTEQGTIKSFWSFKDPKSARGERGSQFVDGKFEFDK